MHGRQTPRQPRWPANPIAFAAAIDGSIKLSEAELTQIFIPVHTALAALAGGFATEFQWCQLAGLVELGIAIEKQGVVRGLAAHLRTAEAHLATIHTRATVDGPTQWSSPKPQVVELGAIEDAIAFHDFQLRELSRSEAERALKRATDMVKAAGGRVIKTPQGSRS